MNPNAKQQILDQISQLLDSVGVSTEDDFYGENVGAGESVPIWSALKSEDLGQGGGPLHDKSTLMKANLEQSKPPQTDNFGMPQDDEGAEMMTALGLV